MVLDLGDIDKDNMVDIPFNESEFVEKTYFNYDIEVTSSLQLTNPLHGGGNYVGPYVDNVLIDPFKWLPDFSSQPSTSISTYPRLVKEGNSIKIGDIFINKQHLKDAMS